MKAKTILYLGNKLKLKGINPTSIDVLGDVLKQQGFNVLAYSSKTNKLFRLLDMLLAIIKHRNNVHYALIDTYSTSAFWFAYISARFLKHFKVNYIPILHGGHLPSRFKKSKKQVLWLLNNAKVNVSPSGYLVAFFKTNGIKNLIEIPNGITLEKYPFRLRPNPKPHLLWVRAFSNIYNPLLAVKILEVLLKAYPEAKLSMVGPAKDNSFKTCKDYVAKNHLPVTFTGKLSKEEWISYAQEFDVFLNTSSIDNTPVSVIEAMAMGMPIVSTNVGGLPYLLKNKENAILLNPNDKREMAKAICTLLESPSLSERLSRNARLTAKKFSWEEVKLRWLDVLK